MSTLENEAKTICTQDFNNLKTDCITFCKILDFFFFIYTLFIKGIKGQCNTGRKANNE